MQNMHSVGVSEAIVLYSSNTWGDVIRKFSYNNPEGGLLDKMILEPQENRVIPENKKKNLATLIQYLHQEGCYYTNTRVSELFYQATHLQDFMEDPGSVPVNSVIKNIRSIAGKLQYFRGKWLQVVVDSVLAGMFECMGVSYMSEYTDPATGYRIDMTAFLPNKKRVYIETRSQVDSIKTYADEYIRHSSDWRRGHKLYILTLGNSIPDTAIEKFGSIRATIVSLTTHPDPDVITLDGMLRQIKSFYQTEPKTMSG